MGNQQSQPYAARLRTARERAGRSIDEMAALLGIITESYWDLEWHDADVLMCLSIQQVCLLCRTLKLEPSALFAEEYSEAKDGISLAHLAAKIESHVEAEQIGLSEFGHRVGWDIEEMLVRPEETFNVDTLRHVCKELGVNWVAVLSETVRQRP